MRAFCKLTMRSCTHSASVRIAAAVSSYISVTERAIYSAGGPTAEVHDFSTEGGFGSKLQQLAFVPDNDLADTDKTRKALVGLRPPRPATVPS